MTASFNAMHKPIRGATLNLIQMIGIYVPMAIVTSQWFGLKGIFVAFAVSYVVISGPSVLLFNKSLLSIEAETRNGI